MNKDTPTFCRADVERLLRAERDDIDFTDDTAFFTQIVNDYEDYARLLGEERLRQERIAEALEEPVTDGIPFLGGAGHIPPDEDPPSLFDIALGRF